MKNKLKKLISLAMILCMIINLAGCSAEDKIEKLVDNYFTGIQNYDSEKVSSCFITSSEDSLPTNSNQDSDFFTTNVLSYLQESAALISYSIDNIIANDSTATAYVSVSYLDASPVITAAMGEYFSQGFSLALSGASESELQNLFTAIFAEKTQSVKLSMIDTTIELECINTNNGWKLAELSGETESKMYDIISCNILNTINSFGSESSAITNNEDTYYEPESFQDIPLKEIAEFATIKARINKCTETNKLTKKYFDDDIAVGGTKFVILDVTIENITKGTMNFYNDFILVDSQGRSFKHYSDAIWYFDETFSYTDLAPNIPATGVLVFNVPDDASDYYLYGIHADTGEGMRLWTK